MIAPVIGPVLFHRRQITACTTRIAVDLSTLEGLYHHDPEGVDRYIDSLITRLQAVKTVLS